MQITLAFEAESSGRPDGHLFLLDNHIFYFRPESKSPYDYVFKHIYLDPGCRKQLALTELYKTKLYLNSGEIVLEFTGRKGSMTTALPDDTPVMGILDGRFEPITVKQLKENVGLLYDLFFGAYPENEKRMEHEAVLQRLKRQKMAAAHIEEAFYALHPRPLMMDAQTQTD